MSEPTEISELSRSVGQAVARLPAEILDRPVDGQRLAALTLREALGARTTHVVFLRHFG